MKSEASIKWGVRKDAIERDIAVAFHYLKAQMKNKFSSAVLQIFQTLNLQSFRTGRDDSLERPYEKKILCIAPAHFQSFQRPYH